MTTLLNLPYSLILGSGSPRRKKMLNDLGLDFTSVSIDVHEDYPIHLSPEDVPVFLAKKKSNHYQGNLKDTVLITADTVVVHNHTILEKPKDEEDAVRMLTELSGDTHKVITGVCLRSEKKRIAFSSETSVQFRALEADEIIRYISDYKPFDKAGSYGIQEWIGCVGVKRINGCFYNVVGLPLSEFYQQLKNF